MLHAELQLRKALLAQPQSQRRKEISSAQVFDNYGLWPQGSGFVSEDSRSYESCSIYSIQGFYAKAVVGLVD